MSLRTRILMSAVAGLCFAAGVWAGQPHIADRTKDGKAPPRAYHPWEPEAEMPHTQTIEVLSNVNMPIHFTFNTTANFVVNNGVSNLASLPANIEPGSNPTAAVNAAIATWNSVGAAIQLANTGTTAVAVQSQNGANVITFANNASNITSVGGAVAVAIYFFNSSFIITDVDIVFNPGINFSTLGSANFQDIQSVLTHELGHAQGLNHSACSSAVMFARNSSGVVINRTLSSDDRAGLLHTYATIAQFSSVGAISGSITQNGNAVYGAHVVARDYITGATVTSTLSLANGTYLLTDLPAGPYYIYAEPLNGPAFDGDIITGFWVGGKNTNFRTTFFGGNTAPTIVRVNPITVTPSINIAVPTTAPTLNAELLGQPATGNGGFSVIAQGAERAVGTNTFVAITGVGFSALADSAYAMPGPGITFGPASTSSGNLSSGGQSYKVFPLNVASSCPPGARDIEVTSAGEKTMFCAAIDIQETSPPSARVVSYGPASNGGGAVAAPLTFTTTAVPSLGNASFGVTITGAPNGSTVYMVFTAYPDYFDLTQGAILLIDALYPVLPLTTFAFPSAGLPLTIGLPIPNQPSLAGVKFYGQCFAPDPASTLTYKTSNGLQFTVR